jgi:hypothetical protein
LRENKKKTISKLDLQLEKLKEWVDECVKEKKKFFGPPTFREGNENISA